MTAAGLPRSPDPSPRRGRSPLPTLLRLLVCAAALAYVLNGVTWGDQVTLRGGQRLRLVGEDPATGRYTAVRPDGARLELDAAALGRDARGQVAITRGIAWALRQSRQGVLLLCLLLFGPVPLMQSIRLRLVLRGQGTQITLRESLMLNLAGSFLNFATPVGITAGDLFKALYLSRRSGQRAEALTAVVLDRLLGLYVMLWLVWGAIQVGAADRYLRYLGHVILLGVLGGAALAWVLYAPGLRRRVGAWPLWRRLPVPRTLRQVDGAVRGLLGDRRCLGGTLLASAALQLAALSAYVLVAYALGLDFSGGRVFDYYAVLGSGMAVAAVPISLQGLGTSEAVYRRFLLGTHGSLAQILCMAMAVRLLNLLWALPGALVILTGAHELR